MKVPLIRQYDQADCGPAALLSILKYYGGDASLPRMRELCRADRDGTSLLDLARAARILGFKADGASGTYEELKKQRMPCIAHVVHENGLNHFIVIAGFKGHKIDIVDPGRGRRLLSREDFLEIWTRKSVLLLSPEKPLHRSPSPSWSAWVAGYLHEQQNWLVQSVFLGALVTVLGLATALFIQLLIDRLIPGKHPDKIIWTGLFLAAVLFLRAGAEYFRRIFLILLSKKISLRMNHDFLRHLFRMPRSFFDTRRTGDIKARMNDGMRIQQAVLLIANSTLIDGLILAGSLVFLFFLHSKLAILSMAMAGAYAAILASRIRSIHEQQNDIMKAFADAESACLDSLKGMDDILGFRTHDFFTGLNQGLFSLFQGRIETLGRNQASLSFFAESAGVLWVLSVLCIGAAEVSAGRLAMGKMMAAYALVSGMIPAIDRLLGAIISLQGADVAARRMQDILLLDQEEDAGSLTISRICRLEIMNGSFSWHRAGPLFHQLNLCLEKGRLTALFGPSGSGKSTLVGILQRKYELEKGGLLLNGKQGRQYRLSDYRKAAGVVPQEIHVFTGTIVENILAGRKFEGIDAFMKRLEPFGIQLFLKRFGRPGTLIGEGGRRLSGGETQWLGLLRALYDMPDVLIVDEGLSSLDIEIERILFTIIRAYSREHAVLLVTHDMRLIRMADYVYMMEKGRIAYEGRPELAPSSVCADFPVRAGIVHANAAEVPV
ncbi:MAG: ATP-binding cassette domain-containing protein [Acidobacteria bacterium]|nr:ATP-binding cassette domain-containing protein [Acidobacteriota bacterium]